MPLNDRWDKGARTESSTSRYLHNGGGSSSPTVVNAGASTSGGTTSSNMSDGSLNVYKNGQVYNTGRNIVRCFDSNNCASGFACIGNVCVQGQQNSCSGGSQSGCGSDCDNDTCGSGSNTDCTSGSCGDDGVNPRDGSCCGDETCCRKDESGTLVCECGPCDPPPPACSLFCTESYNALGYRVGNCSEIVSCDECQQCGYQGPDVPRQCEALVDGSGQTPCWCDPEATQPEPCYKCKENGGWQRDCENCETTYTVEATCNCGRVTMTCRYPGCPWSALKDDCESQALAACYNLCGEDPDNPSDDDECEGACTGVSWCEGDQPEPPCPPRHACTNNGSITAGGKTCYIRTDCDKSNVPDSCGECDCNCNNDCPNCEKCDSQTGKCVSDPACDKYFFEIAWSRQWYGAVYSVNSACDGSEQNNYDGGRLARYSNAGIVKIDAIKLYWEYENYTAQPDGSCGEPSCLPPAPTEFTRAWCRKLGDNSFREGPVTVAETICTSYGYEKIYYQTGVVVGFGDTQQEATDDAYDQINNRDRW